MTDIAITTESGSEKKVEIEKEYVIKASQIVALITILSNLPSLFYFKNEGEDLKMKVMSKKIFESPIQELKTLPIYNHNQTKKEDV